MTQHAPLAVAVAGATGLVGRELMARLADDTRVAALHAVARAAAPQQAGVQWHDWAWLDAPDTLPALDAAFCCLGTTRRDAGSRAALEAVDHGLVLRFARAARAAGVHRFGVISSVGASTRAASHYLRVKGRMEADLEALAFPTLAILRPSLLLGRRDRVRPAEELAQRALPLLSPLLRGRAARYRPITAGAVADALIAAVFDSPEGIHVLHPSERA